MSNLYNPKRRPHKNAAPDQSVLGLQRRLRDILINKMHGLCFSPYIEGQAPGTVVSEQQIRERLSLIRPYTKWIRTFSCTEGNELIPKIAKDMGLKTLVGVWLDDDLDNNELEMKNGLELAKQGYVDMLAVGNEVLLREDLTPNQLIGYLQRASVAPAPVGYVDAYFKFEDFPQVTESCEVIFANCYPYWEAYPLEHAQVYMRDMYYRAIAAGKGKKVIISETGWPNMGTPEGAAVPNYENALRYLVESLEWSKQSDIELFYFAAFDEAWKVSDEGDVGAYWGIWDKDGQDKYAD